MFNRLLTVVMLLLPAGSAVLAQSATEIFEKFRPMVCRVEFYKNVSSQSQIGSYIKIKQNRIGVLVNGSGLVMVNSDVYPLSLDMISGDGASFFSAEPTDFRVHLSDGSEHPAHFIGKDDLSQAAFIQISDTLTAPLPYASFTGNESVQVGQPVFLLELLGESYNFEPLFTPCTINAVVPHPRRKYLIKNEVTALSAGGLVISSQGQVLGVTLRENMDVEFSDVGDFDEFQPDYLEIAPADWFADLIQAPPNLDTSDNPGKAWFGISMQALTPELKNFWQVPAEGGIIIDRIYNDSPAEKAGLQVKDVIIGFDGKPVSITREEQLNRFQALITQNKPGTTIPIQYFRDGKVRGTKIKLDYAPRSIDLAPKYQLSELGMEVRELTRDVLYDYSFPPDTRGVYVFQVDHAAPAGIGGLEVGSVITEVNGQAVEDLGSFQKIMKKVLSGDHHKMMLRVQLRRESEFVFVDVK